jgi:hypothetical protein
LPGAKWATAPSGIIVSALVLTAVPLDAIVVPVLPMEFDVWLRAALDAAELVEAGAACVTEQTPLVVDVVIEAEAAAVGVDEVMGENVDDELDVEEVDDDAVVVPDMVVAGERGDDVFVVMGRVVVGERGDAAVDVDDPEVGEVDVDDALAEAAVVVVLDVIDVDPVDGALLLVAVETMADAGEHAVMNAVAAGGPKTVPAGALVVCVPLGVPPDVLMYMALRMSAFCQYCGAASITT